MCRDVKKARELQLLHDWDEWHFLLVVLIEVNGYKYQDIANVFDVAESTIKMTYYRMIPGMATIKTEKELENLELIKRGQIVTDRRYKLYSLASKILKEEGFVSEDYYWTLDDSVHQVASCVDFDSPGISLTYPKENGSFKIKSVVDTDNFSDESIEIKNEEQLCAVLSVVILLIKNWHKCLIKLEQTNEE